MELDCWAIELLSKFLDIGADNNWDDTLEIDLVAMAPLQESLSGPTVGLASSSISNLATKNSMYRCSAFGPASVTNRGSSRERWSITVFCRRIAISFPIPLLEVASSMPQKKTLRKEHFATSLDFLCL